MRLLVDLKYLLPTANNATCTYMPNKAHTRTRAVSVRVYFASVNRRALSHTSCSLLSISLIYPIALLTAFSYVVIDCEHGHLGWDVAIQHIRAAVRSTTCVFVRISTSACIDLAGIAAPTKRVLDMGAEVRRRNTATLATMATMATAHSACMCYPPCPLARSP